MMSESEFALWFARIGDRIEIRLRGILPENSAPEALLAAMHDALLCGGKRLRPAMLLAVVSAKDDESAVAESAELAACAVECMHCYSLVHDDLPCMDNADSRRGLPSSHKKHGEAVALLAGDCLQSLSFQLLAEAKLPAVAVGLLAAAAGKDGMGGGQAIDLEATSDDEEELRRMHQMKTGALFQCALHLGLMCRLHHRESQSSQSAKSSAPTSADSLNFFQQNAAAVTLRNFADSFGLLFQIANDIKDADADAALGKKTYSTLLGLEGARRAAAAAHQQATAALNKDFSHLRHFADMALASAK